MSLVIQTNFQYTELFTLCSQGGRYTEVLHRTKKNVNTKMHKLNIFMQGRSSE